MKNKITKQSQEVKTKEQPTGRKKFKMKKSVRLTIAGLLAATALVVAVIPTKDVQADDPFNPDKDIPATVDIAMAQDPFICKTATGEYNPTVTPNDSSTKYWAFPMGEEMSIYSQAAGTYYTYYKINRDGMHSTLDAMPVFEISSTTTPASSQPQCINHYVGGETSGYTPAGGVLQLSPTVIYSYESEATNAPFTNVEGGDEATHEPKTWTRYTEQKVDHLPNDDMAKYYSSVEDTPHYYYFNILVETWTRPWTQDATDPTVWHRPDEGGSPIDNGEDPDSKELIKEVCKQNTLVSYIADGAFKGVANFTNMEILNEGESGIYMIGNNAFEDCTQLQSIVLGSNFKSFGEKAFCGCSSLTNITFGASTKKIGDGCFANCTALSHVGLPVSLDCLGTAAFYNCRSLNDAVPDYKDVNEDGKNSVIFGGGQGESGIGINSPFTVGSYAFCNCVNLVNTKMCQTTVPLTTHGKYGMYAGCTSLQQIELPKFTSASFKATPSMFLGCNNLECIRGDNATYNTATDWQFINTLNRSYSPDPDTYTENVSDNFVVWGPNPSDTSGDPSMYKFAKANSLPYMYWDRSDNKFKYIMVLADTYRVIFTEDFQIEKIDELSGGTATQLTIPASIGGKAIKGIKDNACGSFLSDGTYKSNLTKPTRIEISDSIASIGENAFRNIQSLQEVEFRHFPNTTAAEKTSIGVSCFEDCKNLKIIYFKDPDYTGSDEYYSINIDNESVGDRAFRTNGTELTMVGNMEEGYWPYEYAINPNNHFSDNANSYITYKSCNPDNITCKYSKELGKVSLLDYQNIHTIIGDTDTDTVLALLDKYHDEGVDALSGRQLDIIQNNIRTVKIPYGITSIENAKNIIDPTVSRDNPVNYDYFICVNDNDSKFSTDGDSYGLTNLVFESLESLPNITTESHESAMKASNSPRKVFAESDDLVNIVFNSNMKDIGELPFYNYPVKEVSSGTYKEDLENAPTHTLSNVVFNGENNKETATKDDPYYWCANGIIYSYYVDDAGTPHTTIEEVLQSRGATVGQAQVSTENDPDLANVTDIAEKAFKHCDFIASVDLSDASGLETIPDQCFYNCNQLRTIYLPSSVNKVESEAFAENQKVLQDVYFYSNAINVDEDAFKDTFGTYCHGYKESSIPSYVKMVNKKDGRTSADELIYDELTEQQYYTVVFLDGLDYSEIYRKTVKPGEDIATPDELLKTHEGYKFLEYYSDPPTAWKNVQKSTTVYAKYIADSSSSSTTPTITPTTTPTTTSSSSGSTTAATSSSARLSTSITSTTVHPVVVSGAGNAVGAGGVLTSGAGTTGATTSSASGSGSNGSSGGSGSSNNIGKTKLVSTTGGITDTGKMSATVNGSSDNYVIKISESQEANDLAQQALTAAFGSLDAIRYLPFDISLYDSTGQQKISPVPDGVTINITMPIPDALQIYGGNAKVGSVAGGSLEKIQPKFTVISGVPCMNYTVSHLSPYVVYVDTANLSATGTLDSTPKTGDPIHPKWFLVIGLTAISGVLFLKRDKKEFEEALS